MNNTEALREAAQAVLDRWDSPQWAWTKHGPTADLMHAVRAALAQPAASGEPDMRHPKIQALIGGKARREIELQLVEQLLDDPDCDLSAMDMEYWHGLHDKLREKLLAAQPAPARVPLPERLVRFTLRDLKAERARLDGFLALGNELARAAEYDEWIAALEAYCDAHDITPAPTAAQADQSNPQR